MGNNYEEKILTAVDILINNAVANLNYDKTVKGTIYSIEDEGLGIYKVKYQDSVFTAHNSTKDKFNVGTKVYVTIPGNDTMQDRFILGTVEKFNTRNLSTATLEDRMTIIGTNLLAEHDRVGLASYRKGGDTANGFIVNQSDIDMYKSGRDRLMINADFTTALDTLQQSGNGNYGIVIEVEFENSENGNQYSRSYSLNVNNMQGQPYNSTTPTHQSAIFEINGDEFKTISNVYAFCNNFPGEADEYVDDIFVENVGVYFVRELTADEISSASVKITTPLGSYFAEGDTNDKMLKAEVKIQGSAVNSTNANQVEYYWFKKDLSIRPIEDSEGNVSYPEGYSPIGGNGWRCLNKTGGDSIALDGGGQVSAYIPGSNIFTVHAADCPGYETIYKCVAFLDEYTVTDEITIINQNANNIVTIQSSESSTSFSFSSTYNVILTALINNTNPIGNYSCVWGRSADGKEVEIFKVTENSNSIEVNPNDGNFIITYYVEIFKNDVSQGLSTITFKNVESQSQYSVVLHNANNIYKYNTEGVSPANQTIDLKDRITITPITFTFSDSSGREILSSTTEDPSVSSFKIRWWWPANNTLIIPKGITGVYDEATDRYYLDVVDAAQLSFPYAIAETYDITCQRNVISLDITYGGATTSVDSSLLFTKEGELGTNGTRFVARIFPNTDVTNLKYIYVQSDTSGNGIRYVNKDYSNGAGTAGRHNTFILQMFANGKDISSDISSSYWQVLPSSGNISISSGVITPQATRSAYVKNKASIIQGRASLASKYLSNAKYYYATYSIPVVYVSANNNYTYVVDGGWNEAVYDPSGSKCDYDNSTNFRLLKVNKNDGSIISHSNSITWTTSWGNSTISTGNGEVVDPIIPPSRLMTDTNNYILITIGNDWVLFPVQLYYNRYSMAAMNSWDGNNVSIQDENGNARILAPQIAAGSKNTNNTFTGIAIGETFTSGRTRDKIGLFGYNNGVQTIFLNAQDGSARFGANGNYLDINANGEVSIGYSNHKFSVDKDGNLTCTSGRIGGWEITSNYLSSETGNAKLYYNGKISSFDSNGEFGTEIYSGSINMYGENNSLLGRIIPTFWGSNSSKKGLAFRCNSSFLAFSNNSGTVRLVFNMGLNPDGYTQDTICYDKWAFRNNIEFLDESTRTTEGGIGSASYSSQKSLLFKVLTKSLVFGTGSSMGGSYSAKLVINNGVNPSGRTEGVYFPSSVYFSIRPSCSSSTIALTSDLSSYALANHTHSDYALKDHTHSNYALKNHTHSEYAAKEHYHTGVYAPVIHTHSQYATSSDLSSLEREIKDWANDRFEKKS